MYFCENGTAAFPRNHRSAISGGSTASFVYDAFGRRASKTINSWRSFCTMLESGAGTERRHSTGRDRQSADRP
jgi:hypothetical protein